MKHILLKHWCLSTKLHSITIQKTITLVATDVRTIKTHIWYCTAGQKIPCFHATCRFITMFCTLSWASLLLFLLSPSIFTTSIWTVFSNLYLCLWPLGFKTKIHDCIISVMFFFYVWDIPLFLFNHINSNRLVQNVISSYSWVPFYLLSLGPKYSWHLMAALFLMCSLDMLKMSVWSRLII